MQTLIEKYGWGTMILLVVTIITTVIAIIMGIYAVQTMMKVRLSTGVQPSYKIVVEYKETGSSDAYQTLLCNFSDSTHTPEVAAGFTLSGNNLTFKPEFAALGTSFDIKITNFTTIQNGYVIKVTARNGVSDLASVEINSYISGSATIGVLEGLTMVEGAPVVLTFEETLITYTISYNLNGGSISGTNPTTYNANTGNITLINPTKTGYTFIGWTGSNGATAQTSVTIAKGSTGDKSYTAHWNVNSYTVTLDNQSPTTEGTTSATVTYDSAMTSITLPTKTGYTFGGYYTSTGGGGTQYYTATGASARNYDVADALTLYAKWTAITYTIKYNANGGSGSTASSTHTYDVSTNLTANGFSFGAGLFLGWSTDPNATSATYTNGQSVTNLTSTQGTTINLYAIWGITFQLTIKYYQKAGMMGTAGIKTTTLSQTQIFKSLNDGLTFVFTKNFPSSGVSASVSGASYFYTSNAQWSAVTGVSNSNLTKSFTTEGYSNTGQYIDVGTRLTVTITLNKVSNATSGTLGCTLDGSVE